MSIYKANSTNSHNFTLLYNNEKTGDLVYNKWYSFNAEIVLANGSKFTLEAKGLWNSIIELKSHTNILLQFEMGWHGIVIKTFSTRKKRHTC